MNGWILAIAGASMVEGLRSTGLPRLVFLLSLFYLTLLLTKYNNQIITFFECNAILTQEFHIFPGEIGVLPILAESPRPWTIGHTISFPWQLLYLDDASPTRPKK